MVVSNENYEIIKDVVQQQHQHFLYHYAVTMMPWYLNQMHPYTHYNPNFLPPYLDVGYNVKDKEIITGNCLCQNLFENKDLYSYKDFKVFLPIITAFQEKQDFKWDYEVYRMIALLTYPQILDKDKEFVDQPHIDIWNGDEYNTYTLIYFLHDSDGGVVLYNEFYDGSTKVKDLTIKKEIKAKQGKLLIFPSNNIHSDIFPITTGPRLTININVAIRNNV